MRTLEVINADISHAMSVNDAALVLRYAKEAEALEQFERAVAVHQELGDRPSVARATGNIEIVYYATSDYPPQCHQAK